MKRLKQLVYLITTLGLGLLAFYVIIVAIDDDLQFGDGFALFGGGEELGYTSAGYLITYEAAGSFKTCGYTALNNNIGITAGHCLDDAERIEVGKGKFSLDSRVNISVLKGIQKEGWVNEKQRVDDFSILIFNAPINYYNSYATIGSPEVGCNYRVVAYGRTETDAGALSRPRKSASMCITSIEGKIFLMTANESAGICFGDSGSPIYEEGTNKLVGITASIVNESSSNKSSPCDFNNTAIAVRVDSNEELIQEQVSEASNVLPGNLPVSSSFDLEVAQQTFWDKIGFSTVSDEEASQIFLYAGGVFFLLFIMVGLYLYANRKPKLQ